MPKQPSKKTSKKATSRAMTMYRKPRDIDIFKPITTKLVYTDTVLLTSTGGVAFNTYTFEPTVSTILIGRVVDINQPDTTNLQRSMLATKC